MHAAHADSKYKRELLSKMRQSMIRSPIPIGDNYRLGGTRILPLYQSERLLMKIELEQQAQGMQQGKKAWPGRRPYTPKAPSTMMVAELSRDERQLLTPAWYVQYQAQQQSRAASPRSSRAESRVESQVGSRVASAPAVRPNLLPNRPMSRSPSRPTTPSAIMAGKGPMRTSASMPRIV